MRKIAFAILLLVLTANSLTVSPINGETLDGRGTNSLSVLTWNTGRMGYFVKPEKNEVLQYLVSQDADVLCLQEVDVYKDSKYLTLQDNDLIDTMDKEFVKVVGKMDVMDQVRNDLKVAGNEKAYALLEICRKNEIPVSDTAFIGTRNSDFPAMDIVRDSSGLALAFNGSEYAVRGCNVAVMSERPIVAAVLVNEFYNGGIESVMEMIDHWTPDGLKEWPCADRNLMNEMLAQFPKGLPEVFSVTHRNYKQVAKKSLEFRKKHRIV